MYFDVSREQNHFSMFNNVFDNDGLGDGSVWRVIEDRELLRINDVIKLGRFRFKLIDMITAPLVSEEDCNSFIM